MIEDSKVVTRAKKYVGGHKPADVHPDVAARIAGFQRAQDDDTTTDIALQAEASALMALVDALAGADVEEVKPLESPRPAKRTAPKVTASKKSTANKTTAKPSSGG